VRKYLIYEEFRCRDRKEGGGGHQRCAVKLGHLTDFSPGCLASLASSDFPTFGEKIRR
jgi:hypothetical protein